MAVKFENQLEVTEETFVTWAKSPVSRLAKPLKYLLWLFEIAILGVLVWYGINTGKVLMAIFLAIAVVFMNVRGLVSTVPQAKRRFAEVQKALGEKLWIRTIRFYENKVEVLDNESSNSFPYSSLTSTLDQGDFFTLIFEKSTAVRVKKDAFTIGDFNSLVIFLDSKRKENNKHSTSL